MWRKPLSIIAGLGAQTHHLIGGRLIAGDTVSPVGEILDQRAGSLVLDQHDSRTEQHLALTHGALEDRVFEPPISVRSPRS